MTKFASLVSCGPGLYWKLPEAGKLYYNVLPTWKHRWYGINKFTKLDNQTQGTCPACTKTQLFFKPSCQTIILNCIIHPAQEFPKYYKMFILQTGVFVSFVVHVIYFVECSSISVCVKYTHSCSYIYIKLLKCIKLGQLLLRSLFWESEMTYQNTNDTHCRFCGKFWMNKAKQKQKRETS